MTKSAWSRRLNRLLRRERCPECGARVRETHCDVCGYDLILKTRDSLFHRPVV